MSELERLLREYYRSIPPEKLTTQELLEHVYLEVKLGLEEYLEAMKAPPCC